MNVKETNLKWLHETAKMPLSIISGYEEGKYRNISFEDEGKDLTLLVINFWKKMGKRNYKSATTIKGKILDVNSHFALIYVEKVLEGEAPKKLGLMTHTANPHILVIEK